MIGKEALCFQHEWDHLEGVIITDESRALKMSKNVNFLNWKYNDDK